MVASLILITLLIYFLTRFALDAIQIRYVKSMKITDNELNLLKLNRQHLEKSTLYNIDKLIISMLNLIVQIFIIYLFLFAGGLEYLIETTSFLYSKKDFIFGFMNPELFIIITFFLIMTVLGIPMSLYKIFILEEKYGFNKMTIGLFIRDFLISLMLSLLIISILFLSFLFLYSNFEKNWWVLMWVVFLLFNIIFLYV